MSTAPVHDQLFAFAIPEIGYGECRVDKAIKWRTGAVQALTAVVLAAVSACVHSAAPPVRTKLLVVVVVVSSRPHQRWLLSRLRPAAGHLVVQCSQVARPAQGAEGGGLKPRRAQEGVRLEAWQWPPLGRRPPMAPSLTMRVGCVASLRTHCCRWHSCCAEPRLSAGGVAVAALLQPPALW